MSASERSTPELPAVVLEGPGTVQLTLEQRFRILHNIFKHQYFAVYKRIGEQFGWDVANQIAGEVADEATPFLAEAYRRKFDLEGTSAALVSQVLQAEFQGEGSDVAVLEETEDVAEIDVLCTFGDALQHPRFASIPITDGLCERGCRAWMQDVAATVDPALQTDRVTWMGAGAKRCRFRIERRSDA